MSKLAPGTTVQFVSEGPLGLVDPSVTSYKFVADELAVKGDVGTVVDNDEPMPEGWILVKHERTGLYAPVHAKMVSPVV